jgi:hypothetical protein
MDSYRERICCDDLPECSEKKDDATIHYNEVTAFKCICQHPGFIMNCLQWEVLENAWLAYKQEYGARAYNHPNNNKRHRHIAYRQLARFLFGIVGRENRYVLPSCAVNKIRRTFTSEQVEEIYAGFQDK